MTSPSPTSAPSPWLRAAAAIGGLAIVGASVVLSTDTAEAAGLERFASCDELETHLEAAAARVGYGAAAGGDDMATAEDAAGSAPTTAGAQREEAASDGTNTQVEGVDELDLVEVLPDGRILVAREDRVVLVDASGRAVLATLPVSTSPQITFDGERSTLWAVASDWATTTLTRARLDGDAFVDVATWSVAGRLVDLRRDGAGVHLVAVDDEVVPMPMPIEPGAGGVEGDVPTADTTIPFAGTSPVPCDQVLHPTVPGGPATTLVASFAADGALEPVAATEVVGAGDNVLVTADALYLSTPSYEGDRTVTGIHRFDLDGLALTGSGSVDGHLLNQFSLDEHAGHLRAAVTVGGGGFVGVPMPVEPGVAVEDVGGPTSTAGSAGEASTDEPVSDRALAAPVQDPTTSETTVTTVDPTTTTVAPEPTTTTTEAPTTTTSSTTTSTTEATTTTLAPAPGTGLNEVVVLDLEGSLDVVGRTPRFGHEGETLHGIRFAGSVAYAVTFLQTDPLYVIDLADPAAPQVLGELEIPGFSAYLHPLGGSRVVGFGPGGDGQVVARLFDVGDPRAPRLLDTVPIAAESPIVYDHHALRVDGDRLVLPGTDWVSEPPPDCPPVAEAEARLDALYGQLEALYDQMAQQDRDGVPPEVAALEQQVGELSECAYGTMRPMARIVTLTPTGSSLAAASTTTGATDAQRVLPLGDGYLLVGAEITRVGPTGSVEATLA